MTDTTAKSSTATWIVEYSDHDCSSSHGSMIRKSPEDAARSCELLKQCGYRNVTWRQWTR